MSKIPYIFIIILLLTCSIMIYRHNNLSDKYELLNRNYNTKLQELSNANTEISRLKELSKEYEILKNEIEVENEKFSEEFDIVKKSEPDWSDTPIPDSYIKLLNKGRTNTHSTSL